MRHKFKDSMPLTGIHDKFNGRVGDESYRCPTFCAHTEVSRT